MARSSAYRELLIVDGREAGRSLINKENRTGQEQILAEHPGGLGKERLRWL